MAANPEGNAVPRRSILQGAALAIGAVLLPRSADADAPSSALDTLRADYAQRIEALADQLRPRLAGINDSDGDDLREPNEVMNEACREALCPTDQDALLVLACSPNAGRADYGIDDIRDTAAEVAGWDVAALLGAGWWVSWHTVQPCPEGPLPPVRPEVAERLREQLAEDRSLLREALARFAEAGDDLTALAPAAEDAGNYALRISGWARNLAKT